MLEAMGNTKRNFFSGNYAEKSSKMHLEHNNEIFYEGQNVKMSDSATKEKQEEVKKDENKKKKFFANYNMFF